jgi:hypothetical protein
MRKSPSFHSDEKLDSDSPAASRFLLPWWLSGIVICGATLMAMGAIIALVRPALLVSPGAEITEAVHIYAGYLFSRNLAIALVLLVTLFAGARAALGNYLILTAFIQFLDAAIDAAEGRWILVPGVLILGTAFLIGASVIFPRPIWKQVFRRNQS